MTSTRCIRKINPLSSTANATEIAQEPFFQKPKYRSNNPFDYAISISWFGGLQIHCKR